jgi:hypothetical protein
MAETKSLPTESLISGMVREEINKKKLFEKKKVLFI